MKKQSFILLALIILTATNNYGQTPDWPKIKENCNLNVGTIGEPYFDEPYLLPMNTGGWEDGLYISRDGYSIYAFYVPIDFISWQGDIDNSKPCPFPSIAPYYRGDLIGVDTNAFGPCPHWMHSDIIYTTRTERNQFFDPWQSSNLATPLTYEGAPQYVAKNSDSADIFVFSRANTGWEQDIMIMRDVPNNPFDSAKTINDLTTMGVEDNPHIERIQGDTLVLFFDNDGDPNPSDIFYSLSYNNGVNWTPKQVVSSVSSTNHHEVQPHLWTNGDWIDGKWKNAEWYLYYAAEDTLNDGKLSIFRSKKMDDDINNWDNWGFSELVVGPGTITGNYGQVFGVGEPTLSDWGDMTFVVVYGDTNSTDSTDVFDADPWYMPFHIPFGISDIDSENNYYELYPNPFNESATLKFENPKHKALTLRLYNLKGQIMKERTNIKTESVIIKREDLHDGLYFFQLYNDEHTVAYGRLTITK